MSDPIDMFSKLSGLVDTTTPVDASQDDQDALRQFEGMLLKMMLKELRQTMGGEGLFGREGAMYQDWFDDEITQRISTGKGMGLSDRLDLGGLQHVTPMPSPDGLQAVFPVDGKVSSRFGERVDPLSGHRRDHDGLDIAAAEGSPIRAVRAGTVTFAGSRGSYGNLVIVDHGDGLQTRYAHCKSVGVQAGDSVAAGSVVASVGSSGRSTGPHLHLEVRQDERPVDPLKALRWGKKP